MTDFLEVLGIVVTIAVIVGIIALASMWLSDHSVFGFELTAEQKQDEALTQVCMLYHIDNKECFLVYGAIENDYDPK